MTQDTITLRDVRETDLPVFFEQQLDADARRMAGFPGRDRDAFLAHWIKCLADDSGVHRAILCNGNLVGNIVCWGPADERMVGYWLGKEFWNRGIASAALAQFVALVTTRPLFARVARTNPASQRVLHKCGFTIVGEDTFDGPDGEPAAEFVMWLDARE